MIQISAPATGCFQVIIVDVVAGHFPFLTALGDDADLIAVGNAEQFLVVRGDESDALFSPFHVTIQPLADIAVTVEIVFALAGCDPEHIGIMVRICPESIVVIRLNATAGMLMAEFAHGSPVCQDPAVLLIFPESIDDIIEFCLEIIGFQAVPEIKEGGIKAGAVTAKVGTKVSDESCLHTDLLTLGVAVGLLCVGHGPECQFHQRSLLSVRCLFRYISRPCWAHLGS